MPARRIARCPGASLRLAEQSFDRFPQCSSWFRRSGAGDENRHIRSVQNVPCQIAHNVVSKQAARLRCAGHNQVVVAGSGFFENLIDYDTMPEMHFSGDSQAVEFAFLTAQISSEFDWSN